MKKTILMGVLLYAATTIYAQSNDLELPEVIPPSPTVAGLMKFEEVPVSNYTGQPNVSIPLFQKQTVSGFSLPLTLSYNPSGIRVDERSGWLGNGWSISGEAVVSRTVMDIADEADYIDNDGNKLKGIYHNGYFDLSWNFLQNGQIDYLANETVRPIQTYLWNASNKGSSKIDGDYDNDLDIYQVSLFGASARFVIVKNGTLLEPKMLSNDSNLKVTLNYNSTTFVISSFEIQDTNGLKYILSETEQSTSQTATATKTINNVTIQGTNLSFSENQYTSAWKIKEVKNVNNLVLATFNYANVQEVFTAPQSIKENILQSYTNISTDVMAGITPSLDALFHDAGVNDDRLPIINYNNSIALPKWSKSITNLTIDTKKLSTIVFHDGSELIFTLSAGNHPEYTSSGKLLSSVKMEDAFDNVIKEVVFNYTTTANNKTFLTSYQEKFSLTDILNYTLEYDRKELLPEFGSLEKDLWGYYKPDESNVNPVHQTTYTSDKDDVMVGVLKRMHYPTGGVKEFTYEPHEFAHMGSRAFTDAEIKKYNPENWILKNANDSFNNQNASNGYSTTTINFTIDEEQEIYVSSTFVSGDSTDAENASIRIETSGQSSNPYVNNIAIGKEAIFTIPAGNYTMNLFSLTIPGPNPVLNVDADIYYKNYQTNFDKRIYGGGIRIKNIKFLDNATATIPSKQINFAYKSTGNENIPNSNPIESSGVIDGFFTNIKEYSYTKNCVLALEGPGNGQQGVLTTNGVVMTITYKVREHMNSVYHTMTNGASVGYDRVIVSETGNGSSVFEYTSPSDFPTYGVNYGYPFLPEKSRTHMHGAITKQEVFNSEDTLLAETTFSYYPETIIDKAESLFIYDQNCAYLQYYGDIDDYIAHFPTSGREFMGNAQGADPGAYDNCITINNTAPVYYNFYSHIFGKYQLQQKVSKQYFTEGGNTIVNQQTETYEYNSNYLPSKTTLTKSNGEEVVSETYYSSDQLPTFTDVNNSTFLVTDSSYGFLNAQNKITTPVLALTYKKVGSTLELLSSIRNIFTNDNLALPSKIQTNKGELNALADLEDRIIYHSYYSNGNIQEVSKKDGTHVVYIWGYNETMPVAKIENATYAQVSSYVANIQTLSNSDDDRTQGTVGNEGALRSALNNLRTALPNAMITTITYDPLVGVTSMTDPRGNVVYYEYDAFNRLKLVKDKDGHIVSENQYNYKN
ncbi:RHS repeat domain-containing protein [Pseudotenacibaculum sp. MALMAid0570]|uniref:RHS repeat protein n=1 Tax=Pseudotenacibaculum sp. MALMAid0570 TaxID=3143938 RepID=UPI0032E0576E